ncbi:helix-turn-helix domain-containing protein [Elizabethkingia sp. HX WHF]|uniref:winged helix-turn-helix transcriptional regulator n=1 Tax=Elizabethkingia TaxID=308865 RepID=UPI00099A9928|nr:MULTISPECIES: helix-turn-helix domain-containing protein [Elizabethkingia]ATL45028.1 transcriptional regulator [Elizabethkingia miricola]MCL1636792.1 helix-turn-helix transcriptional regulator [Elizabethkingia bruuniana]MDX8564118.1 helix-turn-helix domain-containing protein [Elizabethkingia sp. HX WHF]OPC18873.1 HxlR family transcriptional regulator [Elizabethkingia bruuniana]OPC56688.1 HxlR family transcriptional regulator [Elizabethkingia bruuniana]
MRKENSTNFENEQTLNNYCKANRTLSLISGRWKLPILFALLEGDNLLYSDFKKILPNISDRILSKQLNELQKDNLIKKNKTKKVSAYSLTMKGQKIENLLSLLSDYNL